MGPFCILKVLFLRFAFMCWLGILYKAFYEV